MFRDIYEKKNCMVTVKPLFLLLPYCQILSDTGQAQNSVHVGS